MGAKGVGAGLSGEQVVWVILAGLPGTGKSTLARALAETMDGMAILDKDRVRAALFPGALTDYTREQDDLVMAAIYEAAAYLTRRSLARVIVLDGRTYARQEQRAVAIRAAEASGACWKIVHVVCEDAVAEARLAQQQADHPAQNRTPELYREMKAKWEPITEPHLVVEMGRAIHEMQREVTRYIGSNQV